jgi:hypothetical protein
MRKRVYIALAVVLIILAGVITWQALHLRERETEREPVYQGKGLRVWLIEFVKGEKIRHHEHGRECCPRNKLYRI